MLLPYLMIIEQYIVSLLPTQEWEHFKMSKKNNTSRKKLFFEDDRFQVFNDVVPAGILVVRIDDGRVVFSNKYLSEMLGADAHSLFGGSWEKLFLNSETRQQLLVKFSELGEVRNYEIPLRGENNSIVWGLASMAEVPFESDDLLLFTFVNITQLKNAEDKIRYMANYDTLTGLASRHLIEDRLQNAISRAKRATKQMAVLFIDLDDFKQVNDTYGHEAGDDVLKVVADRILEIVRETDTVGRMGGDEFILIGDCLNRKQANQIAQRIVKSLAAPITCDSGVANIGASVGIALYPDNGNTPDALVKMADEAMYRIKKSGKGNVAFA